MIDNADDDLVESKSTFVISSGDLKLFKVEALVDADPNIDEAFVHVEASNVNSDVTSI
jgi:hypothetical protein